jgi:hypothetical protein
LTLDIYKFVLTDFGTSTFKTTDFLFYLYNLKHRHLSMKVTTTAASASALASPFDDSDIKTDADHGDSNLHSSH